MNSKLSLTDYSIDKFGHDLKNATFLKIYYTLNFAQWAEFVPYSWPLTLYAFLSDKLTWYCWNWADVLIVLSSRAMYMQFKSLYRRSVALSHTVQNEGRHQGNSRTNFTCNQCPILHCLQPQYFKCDRFIRQKFYSGSKSPRTTMHSGSWCKNSRSFYPP